MLLDIKYSNLGKIIDWDNRMVDDNKTIFRRAF
jgi:hypothetical protein